MSREKCAALLRARSKPLWTRLLRLSRLTAVAALDHNEKEYEAGHVVTIEPGVYVPESGGVRVEDTVVVEESDCRVLTQASKDLIVL